MGVIVWILGGLLFVVPSAMVTAVFFVFGMVLRESPSKSPPQGSAPGAQPTPTPPMTGGAAPAQRPPDAATAHATRRLARRLILVGIAVVLLWLGYLVTFGGVLGFARFGLLPLLLSLGLILAG